MATETLATALRGCDDLAECITRRVHRLHTGGVLRHVREIRDAWFVSLIQRAAMGLCTIGCPCSGFCFSEKAHTSVAKPSSDLRSLMEIDVRPVRDDDDPSIAFELEAEVRWSTPATALRSLDAIMVAVIEADTPAGRSCPWPSDRPPEPLSVLAGMMVADFVAVHTDVVGRRGAPLGTPLRSLIQRSLDVLEVGHVRIDADLMHLKRNCSRHDSGLDITLVVGAHVAGQL